MRNIILDSEYNRGALDMALLFINELKNHKGAITDGNLETKKQFLSALEALVIPHFNATELIRSRHPFRGMMLRIHREDGKIKSLSFDYD